VVHRSKKLKCLALVGGVVFLAWTVKLAIVFSSGTLVGPLTDLPYCQDIVARLAPQGDLYAQWQYDAHRKALTVVGKCDPAAYERFVGETSHDRMEDCGDALEARLLPAAREEYPLLPFSTRDPLFFGSVSSETDGKFEVRGAMRRDARQFILSLSR